MCLLKFLSEEWSKQEYAERIGNRVMYVTHGTEACTCSEECTNSATNLEDRDDDVDDDDQGEDE